MKSIKSDKGFTFVELIISMAILSLVAVAIVGVMSSNTVVFRKTKTDLEVQNVAMDSMTMLENDIMQAKYIEIESTVPNKKYICSSDINISEYIENDATLDNESGINSLISMTETQLKNIYKGFKNDTTPPSDPTKYDTKGDEDRAIFDSYYYKVRYMTEQEKLVYKLFLDKVDYHTNKADIESFDTLNSSTKLEKIKKITIVYPMNLSSPTVMPNKQYLSKPDPTPAVDPNATPEPTPASGATPGPTPTPDKTFNHDENVAYECCTVTYEVNGNELYVTRTYSSTTDKNITSNTYTDYIDGDLSGYVNGKKNAISLNVKFKKNNRQYDSDKSIVIRNSNVLNDAK